jgi:hypothetical protein
LAPRNFSFRSKDKRTRCRAIEIDRHCAEFDNMRARAPHRSCVYISSALQNNASMLNPALQSIRTRQ